MIPPTDIVDLFAGPGGWSLAAAVLGLNELGIEFERWACTTRHAAGFRTIHADVATLNPSNFRAAGLIASAPCQAFSTAGRGHGRDLVPELMEAIDARNWAARPDPDPRVWLVLEIGRWVDAMRPEWVALEQVPAVLPLWDRYAAWLRELGYHTWCGILNATDYGVPQTRRRAVLMAHRRHLVAAPHATHARDPIPSLFGTPEPWVTMADALGWQGRVGFPRVDDRGDSPDGYRERDWRSCTEPAATVTEKARSWQLSPGENRKGRRAYDLDEPAPTLAFGNNSAAWKWTLHTGRNSGEQTVDTNAIRITPQEALILQSFPPSYPVQGTKTRQFEQIGNAVPPLLAWHILRALVDPQELVKNSP